MLPQSLSVTVARTHPAILRWRNQDADFDGEVTAQFLTAKHEVAMAAPCVTDGRALSCSLTAEQIEQLHTAYANRIELVYADQSLVALDTFPLIIRNH